MKSRFIKISNFVSMNLICSAKTIKDSNTLSSTRYKVVLASELWFEIINICDVDSNGNSISSIIQKRISTSHRCVQKLRWIAGNCVTLGHFHESHMLEIIGSIPCFTLHCEDGAFSRKVVKFRNNKVLVNFKDSRSSYKKTQKRKCSKRFLTFLLLVGQSRTVQIFTQHVK